MLALAGHITGRVTDADGVGLEGISVQAHRADGTGDDWSSAEDDFVLTDAEGNYDIGGGLPEGDYRVEFSDDSGAYISEWFDNKPELESADDVAVTAGGTTSGVDAELAVMGDPPADPANLTATVQVGSQTMLTFTDNATDETSFTVQRAVNSGAWELLTTLPANTDADPTVTGTVTYTDTTVIAGDTYDYRVRADKGAMPSGWSNTSTGLFYLITPSVGEHGSISPATEQTVMPAYSQSFTITPDAGYHILDVLVDDVSDPDAVAAGSYTFTNVTANHTISATFTPAAFSISVSVPGGTESWPAGSTQNLGWTVSSAVDVGQFAVWLINRTTGAWYDAGYYDAVAGATDYSPSFSTLGIPEGTYAAVVYYRVDPTQWVWSTSATSTGTATITAAAVTIATTVPAGGEEWTAGSTQSLGWSILAAVDVGQFGVWLINETTGAWYEAGYYDAVAAQTVYTPSFVVPAVPAGTYKAIVYYRVDPTQWVWSTSATSTGTATITPAAFSISVSVPGGTESWPAGSTQDLGWTVSSAVDVGQFAVWLINQTTGAWYDAGYHDAVAGATDYAPSFSTLGIPEGTYTAVVYYREDPTQWVWSTNATSTGTATITAAAFSISVSVPNGTESWPSGSTQNLGWTVSSAVDVGQFAVWLVNQTTGAWYDAGYYDAVAGATDYAPSFSTLGIPEGTYTALVYYREDPTQWVWSANATSTGTATITAAAVTIATTVPAGGEEWTAGSTQSLGWSILAAVDVGQFGVWLINETTGAWYEAGYYDAGGPDRLHAQLRRPGGPGGYLQGHRLPPRTRPVGLVGERPGAGAATIMGAVRTADNRQAPAAAREDSRAAAGREGSAHVHGRGASA